MKKLFFVLTVSVALFQLSSCAKKQGCTDPTAPNYNSDAEKDNGSCIDLTENIVGTYEGNIADSLVVDESSTETAEIYEVTKIDNSHIKLTSASGDFPEFTAEVIADEDAGVLVLIDDFSFDGTSFEGFNICSNGICGNGGLDPNDNLYIVAISTDGSRFLGFTGQRQ